MPIYLVERTGYVGYDEHDGFVIVAANKKDARKIAQERATSIGVDGKIIFSAENAKITEVDPSKEGIVLASFNAG